MCVGVRVSSFFNCCGCFLSVGVYFFKVCDCLLRVFVLLDSVNMFGCVCWFVFLPYLMYVAVFCLLVLNSLRSVIVVACFVLLDSINMFGCVCFFCFFFI